MRLAEHEQRKERSRKREVKGERESQRVCVCVCIDSFPFNCINRDLGDIIDNMSSWVLADGQNKFIEPSV